VRSFRAALDKLLSLPSTLLLLTCFSSLFLSSGWGLAFLHNRLPLHEIRLSSSRSSHCRWSSCRFSSMYSRFLDVAAVCLLDPLSASYLVACFRPWSLMPLFHSRPFHSFSPSFRRYGVLRFAWFLVQPFLTRFSLRHATVARLVLFLLVTANIFRGPQFFWV
jgi:hypothetical protein